MHLDDYFESNINTFDGAPVILGIDEAGRGPVLGHMVYGAFYCPQENEAILRRLKVDDSKKLTDKDRQRLVGNMTDLKMNFGWRIHGIRPENLSAIMLRKFRSSLNEISHDSAINLIRHTLSMGVNVKEVYVDTVGNAQVYQAKLKRIYPDILFKVEEKADATFPVVSAASIFAKVTRDRLLEDWQFREIGGNKFARSFGCGYPGDAQTKAFLTSCFDRVFGFPSIVRFSWSTAADMIEKDGVAGNWYENSEGEAENQSKILSFFATSDKDGRCRPTHTGKVFTRRRLEGVHTL